MMKVAVVGHVEWIEFARVDRVPLAGEIVQASETWEQPGGGGAVAAVQLRKLAGSVILFTAFGDDQRGHLARSELESLGVQVAARFRTQPQRRGFTFLDARGERTITVMGDRMGPRGSDSLPWDELNWADAVYFTAGDDEALRAARRARLLVATSRVLPQLVRARVPLDVVVGSGRDPAERYRPTLLDPPPRLVVTTMGRRGGSFETAGGRAGRYRAAPVPGLMADSYGCGDSFAAGLTYALGAGLEIEEALEFAARCGAACLTGRGPFAGQLTLHGPKAGRQRAG